MISSSERFSDLVERELLLPEFRDRFTVIEVTLPTLRERRDEFPLLAQQALESCNHPGKQLLGLSPDVWEQFRAYNWPGNLDELSAVVSEAHVRCAGSVMTVADLPFRFRAGRDAQTVAPLPSVPQVPLEERLLQVEREHLVLALERSGGNKQLAAEILAIPRAKLYRRLEAHGLLKREEGEPP
jgi:DNA-binding NtrC family response regulator